MKIIHIAAIDLNNGLGKNNKLLYHIKKDMARFVKLTTDNTIIVGRKTFESFGGLLADRIIIILTRDPNYKVSGAIVVHSLKEAFAKALGSRNVYVVGGEEVYKQTIHSVDILEITKIFKKSDADTFYPKIPSNFKLKNWWSLPKYDKKTKLWYRFETWVKK